MKLLTTKSFVTFLLSLFLVAVMFDVASANEKTGENDKKTVVYSEKTKERKENEGRKIQKKVTFQKASTSTEKENTVKATTKKREIKQDNSESVLSYNFIFYLVYEFKFSDILNFEKGRESQHIIDRPIEDILFDKGKSLFNWLISTISY